MQKENKKKKQSSENSAQNLNNKKTNQSSNKSKQSGAQNKAKKTAPHSDTLHWPISRRILCSRSLYRSDCAGGHTGKHGLLRSICHIPFYFLSRKRELDSKLSHRSYYQCHAAGFLHALCHINRRMYCHHLSGDYHLAGCTISKT